LAQQGETRAIEQLDKRSRKRNFHSTHKLASPVAHVPINAKIYFCVMQRYCRLSGATKLHSSRK
ncbi:hypothetical protein, partial [Stutzerimonas nitrititolerans]|uniref:hypothetical protein n=1 Tax=Stutzerimonas nitrititolerans TaxID=2482751 RepID=UPI002898E20D